MNFVLKLSVAKREAVTTTERAVEAVTTTERAVEAVTTTERAEVGVLQWVSRHPRTELTSCETLTVAVNSLWCSIE